MKQSAVIGVGFGDEGKGRVVSYLCSARSSNLVMRFSGGHQAGHNVVLPDGTQHISSNFGSGIMYGADTFWYYKCVMDPIGIYNEAQALISKGFPEPGDTLYIAENCPVCTPYEKLANQYCSTTQEHGTCGVGYGKTLQREEEHHSITYKDLFHKSALDIKLRKLYTYYNFEVPQETLDYFMEAVDWVTRNCHFAQVGSAINSKEYDHLIFEGSQGLLLDEKIGFFPNVTRGRTDTSNIAGHYRIDDLYLVTRAYHSRHGNGPMNNWFDAGIEFLTDFKENPYEHNREDGAQGKFRTSWLDLDLLAYACDSDPNIRNHHHKTLVITCMDQMNNYRVVTKGKLSEPMGRDKFVEHVLHYAQCPTALLSYAPTGRMEAFSL